jgi:ABC-type amino acid transport substrate-binding protein
MLEYNSEHWNGEDFPLDTNLEWLGRRGFMHVSTAREHGDLKGYIISVFSGTTPLASDLVQAHNADAELYEKDKTFLQWHGVAKIVRGKDAIWTN